MGGRGRCPVAPDVLPPLRSSPLDFTTKCQILSTVWSLQNRCSKALLSQGNTTLESQTSLVGKKIPAFKNTTHLFFHVQNLILKSHTHTHTHQPLKTPHHLCPFRKFCHQMHSSSGRCEGEILLLHH